MIANKLKFSAMFTTAAFALLAGSAFAQVDVPHVGSDLSLVVDGGSQLAVIPVVRETAQNQLLTYDLAIGEVEFSSGVLAPDYDEPLFCFDLGVPQSAVSIKVTDPNGHLIIDNFDVGAALEYDLDPLSPGLWVTPTASQQCFYRSDQGVFGLFGRENTGEVVPEDLIARDRFEVSRSLNLEYVGVPEFATPGQTFSYDLVVTNTGTGDLNDVALQELFPENLAVYAAALTGTTWTCSATGDAVCPASVGSGYLRFEEMNAGGVDITAGDSLTFTIERTVDANSITGESIRIQAGTVADPVATNTPFEVAEALITVIGESAGLNVSASTASADSAGTTGDVADDAQITVTVLDSSQNPVPNEPVSLDNAGGLSVTSATSGTSDPNGQVNFTATAQGSGDYTISFTSGTLSGSGTVTILPGEPDTFFLQESVPTAVADGQDTIEVLILVEDQYDNAVDSALVEVTDNDGLSSIPASEFTDIDGIATFNASSTSIGTYQPVFSVPGVVGSSSATVSFEAGAPDDLEFTLQPPNPVIADVDFDVSLNVVDSQGNLVSDDQVTFVTLNLQQGGSTIRTLTSGSVTNGQVTFTVGTIGPADVGTNYRIQAVASGTGFFGANSTTFEITQPQ